MGRVFRLGIDRWAKALEEHQLIFEAALAARRGGGNQSIETTFAQKPFFLPGRQLEPISIVFSTAQPILRPKDIGE